MKRKIYVASSWRNEEQPKVVAFLRELGHEVYDFKNPPGKQTGFGWRDLDPGWQSWTPQQYREALKHPVAKAGFDSDFNAMKACDTCVLVLPSGRSASFEFGWCRGANKYGVVFMPVACEPELMYLGNPIAITYGELAEALEVKYHPTGCLHVDKEGNRCPRRSESYTGTTLFREQHGPYCSEHFSRLWRWCAASGCYRWVPNALPSGLCAQHQGDDFLGGSHEGFAALSLKHSLCWKTVDVGGLKLCRLPKNHVGPCDEDA